MKYWISEIVDINITCASLIYVNGKPPHSHGNYFWLNNFRVLNFWEENLIAANTEFNLNNQVKILRNINTYHCVIDDRRIPKEWYSELYFVGDKSPKVDHIKELYDYYGDPNNEFEQFIDPKSYYEKRGQQYIEGENGFNIIKYTIPKQTKVLKCDWILENSEIHFIR